MRSIAEIIANWLCSDPTAVSRCNHEYVDEVVRVGRGKVSRVTISYSVCKHCTEYKLPLQLDIKEL